MLKEKKKGPNEGGWTISKAMGMVLATHFEDIFEGGSATPKCKKKKKKKKKKVRDFFW
jgi:hypothetical protein